MFQKIGLLKKSMRYLFVILSVVAFASSCTEEIPLDGDYQHSKIVVNSVFSTDLDTLDVYLTETRMIYGFDKDFAEVNNAKLSLYDGDQLVGNLEWCVNDIRPNDEYRYSESFGTGSRYCLGGIHVDDGSNYTLKVEHPSLGEAVAETTIPIPVEIKSIVLKKEEVIHYGSISSVLVAYVTFEDPADVDNYYQVLGGSVEWATRVEYGSVNPATGYYESKLSDTLLVARSNHPSNYEQIDPLIRPNEEDLFNYTENIFQVFNDELINGKTYTLRYVVDGSFYEEDDFSHLDSTAGEYYKVDMRLRSIPKELYLYYVSAEEFYWNDGNPFSEPVQVFSNIENGVGIFSAYSLSTFECLKGAFIPNEKVYMSHREYYDLQNKY